MPGVRCGTTWVNCRTSSASPVTVIQVTLSRWWTGTFSRLRDLVSSWARSSTAKADELWL